MDKITDIEELYSREYLRQYKVQGPVDTNLVFTQQELLMRAYIDAGRNLPEWSNFDMVDADNQTFIRSLISYLEEEIIEAEDAHRELFEAVSRNCDSHELLQLVTHLNEEVADGLHFWLELFIYSGIGPRDLSEHYRLLSLEKGMNSTRGDIMELSLQFAGSFVKKEYPSMPPSTVYRVESGSNTWVPYLSNGAELSPRRNTPIKLALYEAVKNLKLVGNTLKNKYWKSLTYPVDHARYNHHLMEAWLHWTVAINLMGFNDSVGILETYLLKNKVNHNKITLA